MPNTKTPSLFKPDQPEEHRREIAMILQEVLIGKTNNRISITLKTNAVETVILRERISSDTVVAMTAQTATASAAQGLWVETSFGRITIHHDSDAAADRRFAATLVG